MSIIAAPLPGRGRPVGVLYVDSQRTATGFTEGDRAVFEALAGLVATAIEQTRLAHTQRELDVARRIQRRMAPRGVPAPTEFDVAFEGMSAVETSGDYHDVIPLADGRLALVVGDVSGHGLGAALYMTSARAALHTLLRSHDDPLELLGDLNAYLCGDMEPSDFMTLFLGIVDPRARSLWWASAGHVSLHWRLGTGITELPGWGRTRTRPTDAGAPWISCRGTRWCCARTASTRRGGRRTRCTARSASTPPSPRTPRAIPGRARCSTEPSPTSARSSPAGAPRTT